MKNGKFFIVNGRPKTKPPKPISPPLSTLSSMTVGGWGDPHMYITTSSLDSKNRLITKTIAQWGDNKPGTAGNNELILLDLQTSTNTIKVLYTNKAYGTPKVVSNVRVIYNGTSTTYNDTIKFTAGPVNIKILKIGSGNSAYLNFEISWSDINNVVKLGGAIVPILKRVASSNGTLWNGGDGALWDGFGKALAPYGLTRSSFETGISIQAVSEELILSENEASFLTIATENFTQNSNIFDNLQNLGENGEGDNANIGDWDATYSDILPVLSDPSGLDGAIDIAVSGSTTTTTTAPPSFTSVKFCSATPGAGSYSVPDGASSMLAYVFGGGGGGYYLSSCEGSNDGGEGGLVVKTYSVSYGNSVSYNIGTSGLGGYDGGPAATAGGSSSLTYNGANISAGGGGAGTEGNGTGANGVGVGGSFNGNRTTFWASSGDVSSGPFSLTTIGNCYSFAGYRGAWSYYPGYSYNDNGTASAGGIILYFT